MDADKPNAAWTRHNWREYQRRRAVRIECADGLLALGRRVLAKYGDARWGCRALTKASIAYMAAGLTRRGQAVWRLAQAIHRRAAPVPPSVLMTESEVCELTGLIPQAVRRLVARGDLPHGRAGDSVIYVREAIEAWTASHRRGGTT
jgi:predicted DNA-binding transcriptional regulator AlpA